MKRPRDTLWQPLKPPHHIRSKGPKAGLQRVRRCRNNRVNDARIEDKRARGATSTCARLSTSGRDTPHLAPRPRPPTQPRPPVRPTRVGAGAPRAGAGRWLLALEQPRITHPLVRVPADGANPCVCPSPFLPGALQKAQRLRTSPMLPLPPPRRSLLCADRAHTTRARSPRPERAPPSRAGPPAPPDGIEPPMQRARSAAARGPIRRRCSSARRPARALAPPPNLPPSVPRAPPPPAPGTRRTFLFEPGCGP